MEIKVISDIKIVIDNTVHTMTYEEAKKLYELLKGIFGNNLDSIFPNKIIPSVPGIIKSTERYGVTL